LAQSGYTWIQISPRDYEIRAVWPNNVQKPSRLVTQVEPGKTYFFEVTGLSHLVRDPDSFGPLPMTSAVKHVGEEIAKDDLKKYCRFQAPLKDSI
jgi:hypothetical protein